jgi:hypothetical protein
MQAGTGDVADAGFIQPGAELMEKRVKSQVVAHK